MGIIRMGIPEDLTIFIKDLADIKSFIETGTYLGQTSAWASQYFESVITIEYSEEIYKKTLDNYRELSNVRFLFGDSRKLLESILPTVEQSILWLDAHWCSSGSYGIDDQCPLIKEIDIINSNDKEHIILIDDARLFLAPPPLPNSIQYFPDLNQLLEALNNKKRVVFVYEDVFIIVPVKYKNEMQNYLQKKTTEAWQKYGIIKKKEAELSQSKIKQTKYYLKKLIKTWL